MSGYSGSLFSRSAAASRASSATCHCICAKSGWEAVRADTALASFHAVSLIAVLPIAFLSDRLHLRRGVLAAAAAIVAVGIGLLSIVEGVAIWVGVLLAGSVRDGFMSVFMTAVTEVPGVGSLYAGTALGLVMTLQRVGGLVAPPLGNALAATNPRMPFVFWAGMAALGLLTLLLARRSASAVADRNGA